MESDGIKVVSGSECQALICKIEPDRRSKEAVDLASSLVVHILFDIAIINFDQNNSKYVYYICTQYSECLSCIYCSVSFFIVFIAL